MLINDLLQSGLTGRLLILKYMLSFPWIAGQLIFKKKMKKIEILQTNQDYNLTTNLQAFNNWNLEDLILFSLSPNSALSYLFW